MSQMRDVTRFWLRGVTPSHRPVSVHRGVLPQLVLPWKTKAKKTKKAVHDEQLLAVELPVSAPSAKGDSDDENTVENILQPPDIVVQSAGGRVTRSMKARFGTEVTNSPEKRSVDQNDEGEQAYTPPKRSRQAEGMAAPMASAE